MRRGARLRFLIAPHHVNDHLEHPLFMTVPHYNLPKAQSLAARGGRAGERGSRAVYRAVLQLAIRERAPA